MRLAFAKGPMYQLAEFFFLYAGFLNDTLFIRISLILAQFFIALWTCLGVPTWPYLTWPIMEAFPIDSVLWSGFCIIVAGIPLIRQLRAMQKEVFFRYGSYSDEAEALWRDWFRRTGMSRADFKMIMDLASWIEYNQGDSIPMHSTSLTAEELDGENIYGDLFYYVVGGRVDCQTSYTEGIRTFQAREGNFFDAFALLQALGQPTAGLVMQLGPLTATVCEDSEWTLISDELQEYQFVTDNAQAEAVNVLQSVPGAVVLQWRRPELTKVLNAAGLGKASFSLLVTQSTLDGLFRAALPVGPRERYDVISDVRRRWNSSASNDCSALRNTRSRWHIFFAWWISAHNSFRDFWRPGPEQRGMNSPQIGSNESIVRLQVPTPERTLNFAESDLDALGGSTPSSRKQPLAPPTGGA